MPWRYNSGPSKGQNQVPFYIQLTQRWCAPTRRTNVYRDWFRDSGTQLHSGHCQIDRLHSVRQGIGCQHVETELVKVLQLKYPTISNTSKQKEIKKHC